MLFRTLFNKYNPLKHGAIVALCLFPCGCKHNKDADLPPISDFIVDSLYLPITQSDHQKLRIKEIGVGKFAPEELIAFVRDKNFMYYTYNIEKGKLCDSIDLSGYKHNYVDFFPISMDSVYVVQENNRLTLVTKNTTKQWNIQPVIDMIGNDVFIAYLSAEPLYIFNDTVVCTTSTFKTSGRTGPNTAFQEVNFDVVFKLYNDSVKLLYKYNPNLEYFKNQDYYTSIERVFLNAQSAVYSYSHTDTLIQHNFLSEQNKFAKLKTNFFIPNKPYDYSRNQDYKYLVEYEMEQTRLGIGTLLYNAAQHQVYQLLQHKGKYIEEDGRKNKFEDLPYSLFVLDDDLNQKREIIIPANTFSATYYLFTTCKGLYMAAHPSKQRYHDKMLFYRIVIP